jgi:hypothetical protein
VHYIADPVEWWCAPDKVPLKNAGRRLTVCWVGSRGNWPTLEPIRELFADPDFADLKLVTISDHPNADIPWSQRRVRSVVPRCDMAIVPTGTGPRSSMKSSNRVALFMAAGVPVVAGRIDSYEEVITPGWNGFLAGDPGEYGEALRRLRDPGVRDLLRRNAFDYARQNLTLEKNLESWLELFASLSGERSGPTPGPRRGDDGPLLRFETRADIGMTRILLRKRRYAAACSSLAGAAALALRHPSVLGEVLSGARHLVARKTEPERSSRAEDSSET